MATTLSGFTCETVYEYALALCGLRSLALVLDDGVPPGHVEVSELCVSINPSDRPDGDCPA